MVHTRTSDFTQDVPEPSNARAGAAKNELHNAAREPRAGSGHVERAHVGVVALM
jgi:hypothetical protein